jgi:hypothetical protein
MAAEPWRFGPGHAPTVESVHHPACEIGASDVATHHATASGSISTAEVPDKQPTEHAPEPAEAPEKRPPDHVRETVVIIVLSVTAVLAAWCGFESSKWSGKMSIAFSQASSSRIEAARQDRVTKNVAADHRDKLIEMIGRWWAEAGKYNVMPIDGSMLERLRVERPTIAKPRDRFVYYPGGSPVPFSAAPKVYNRAFSITADVQIPEASAEGVLVAHGGRVGGYSFFVKDSRLHFVYNFLGRDFFTVVSNTEVPVGDVSLTYELEPTGEPDFAAGKGVPASGQLYIDGKLVGAVDMPHTVPNVFSTEGLTCGHDGGGRVAPDDHQDDFAFTGTLKRVTFDLSGDLITDTDTDMKVALARQ